MSTVLTSTIRKARSEARVKVCFSFFLTQRQSEGQKYHSNRGYSQESLHHVFPSKSLEFSRYGGDNDERRSQMLKFFSIKINTSNVSSTRTRNSTREKIIYKSYK